VIGHVADPGDDVAGLLYYLFGPGRRDEHVNPHLVGGWEHPSGLEPPAGVSGGRDFRRLAGLLEDPVAAIGKRAPAMYVWHCVLRAAPGDPPLGDGAWMDITARVMDRTGLSERGREHDGVRWIAVYHGDQHVHILATLARQEGHRASVNNLFWKIGAALGDVEKEYGLRELVRDKTADKAPTQAEMSKARAAGQTETARAVLRRVVQAAAAAARTDTGFLAAIEARGALARPRYSTVRPGEIIGYSVSLPGDTGPDGRPIWYGGGKLASDLTLPKLRQRWAGPDGRLTGRAMGAPAARPVLAREALRAARAVRSEPEFFALLEQAGLQVQLRAGPARPGHSAGWSVTLPGLTDRAGQPVWYGGGTLDSRLRLGELRTRWRAGQTGAAPGRDLFAGADIGEIYTHAASVGQRAAAAFATADLAARADIAWAAADLIAAAAEATGSAELARAAEGFARAARPAWGRLPVPTPDGAVIRTAAYLLAGCLPGRYRRSHARRALVIALTELACTLAEVRARQAHRLQQDAAARAAAVLAVDAAQQDAPVPAATAFLGPPRTARPEADRLRTAASGRPRPPGTAQERRGKSGASQRKSPP
jgi:hypothetical protein